MYRSIQQRCSVKKGIVKNFSKFTGKHLCQSFRPAALLKKRFWHWCFPLNFAKHLRAPFLQNAFRRLLLDVYKPTITYYYHCTSAFTKVFQSNFCEPCKRQPHKIGKYTQTIRRLPTNSLGEFHHCAELVVKGLN